MPIKIADGLPALEALKNENIFVMKETRAQEQDIRPLRIAILNLMPTKIDTEIQLMRLLSNTPLQIEVTLVVPSTHESKNTSVDYLNRFYKKFSEIEGEKFDGLIITGAPLEDKEFDQVDYWDEMCRIFEWSKTHATTTLHICWASLAGLYYHYGISKHAFTGKKSGIYEYRNLLENDPLMRGVDQILRIPQSRYATVDSKDIERVPHLSIAAQAGDGDPGIIISDLGQIFITGHMEYDYNTLAKEYERDIGRGLNPQVPVNYFPMDNPAYDPVLSWRSHSMLVFTNWLNYYVYQSTPYNMKDIGRRSQDA